MLILTYKFVVLKQYIVNTENVIVIKNRVKTSQIIQNRFLIKPYAVIKLSIPIKLICGGKFEKGKMAKNVKPVIP